MTLSSAAEIAQRELIARGLDAAHSVISAIFLKTPESSGHYDIRIDPPARLNDKTWLRGFTIAADGSITPCTTFRAAAGTAKTVGDTLSIPPKSGSPQEWGLGPGAWQG